jgi:hypothetical protein
MIIHTTSVIPSPLVLVVWLMDIYLLLISIRLLTSKLKGVFFDRVCQNLKLITDPIPQIIQNKIVGYRHRQVPEWISWLIVIAVLFCTRYGVIWIIVSIG